MERTHTATGQQGAKQGTSLDMTVKRFTDAFNRFDAKEVASFWAEDGTLLNPVGHYGKGRAGVEKVYRDDAQTILGGSTSRFTITGQRAIGEDCVLLDMDHDVQNFRHPDGSIGPMQLHLVVLAKRQGEDWKWLDARPYAFMSRRPSVH